MGVDRSSLCHEQSTRGTGPLGIILQGKVPVNVGLVCSKPGQWTEDNTMLEVHTTDPNRLEEFR